MKTFNVLRYVLAIFLPVIVFINLGSVGFLVSVILILYANNVIDDIVFYHGSKYVDVSVSDIGLPSPVEGLVTLVERRVPLFNHLLKTDILTKEDIVNKGISLGSGEYNHVAIFLNKLNKHLVASIGELKSIRKYSFQSGNIEMVEEGELLANNKGCYLRNTFIDLEYYNGVHVVVTMDKYISKAVRPLDTEMVEMLICRGSQCDIYAPSEMFPFVKCYDTVDVLQPIFHEWETKVYDGVSIRNNVEWCIEKSGFTFKEAFSSNLKKTLMTVNYNYTFLVIALISALFCPLSAPLGFYIYLFLFDRSVKNYLYAIMNIKGYKPWMTNIYNLIHKIVVYGKQRT